MDKSLRRFILWANQMRRDSNPRGQAGILYVLPVIVLAAAAMRMVPHPPNLTPLAAVALFAGSYCRSRIVAIIVPLVAMLLSDLVLGFHATMPFVYASYMAIAMMGIALGQSRSMFTVLFAAVAASVLFFVVSNCGCWLLGGLYPKTWAGLISCYVAAIPFFQYTIAGDLFFCAILFGSYRVAAGVLPMLRNETSCATTH